MLKRVCWTVLGKSSAGIRGRNELTGVGVTSSVDLTFQVPGWEGKVRSRNQKDLGITENFCIFKRETPEYFSSPMGEHHEGEEEGQQWS